ncbi:molybdopterin-guanine dinucleotide biosynthesis protein B [Lachnospiraceae bacterium 42-17]|jgi:molybdopterin-guanine dinucleotide biosynthesis protein B|nr:molybdopterin-guanine dinucleotide biosynthesis protein B [Dorea sp.]
MDYSNIGDRTEGGHEGKTAKKAEQIIISVCGVKNSGKTTLLAGIVKELIKRGKKPAVIKHDGHDFSCDVLGTDSWILKEAGAYGTAVFSDSRIFIHKTGTGEGEKELIRMFPEADVILIEGMKEKSFPKIEVIREGVSTHPVSNPEGRFLIVTDRNPEGYDEETAGFEEAGRIVDRILQKGWKAYEGD